MKRRSSTAPTPVSLIEDAIALLRETPFGAWTIYFSGAVPFGLGLLYFWSDMAQSAFALQRAGSAAFGMALLFFWLKTCQALFAERLRSIVLSGAPPAWSWRHLAGTAFDQFRFHAWGLLLVPVAAVLIVPAAFVYGYFQLLTALPPGEAGEPSRWRRAWKEAFRWPADDHMTVVLLAGIAALLLVNLLTLVFLLPFLLKTLFDYETLFSRSPWTALNSTLLLTLAVATWLCWDPLVKAVHVLRVFRGEGRATGADLLARLRHLKARSVALLVAIGWIASAQAADSTPVEPPASTRVVATGDLNRSIDEVLQQRRYSWRIPREEIEAAPETKGENALQRWLRDRADSIGDLAKRLARRIADLFQPRGSPRTSSNISFTDAATILKWILILLIGVVVVALVWLLARAWIQRPKIVAATADIAPAIPDLADENVSADQLPEDGWMRLALELMGKGDLRLAVRALYLASLAHLAQRELVRLAKHKSNRDYLREVDRRARARPAIVQAFSVNVGAFDRVWYGRSPATDEVFQEFRRNVERIRSC